VFAQTCVVYFAVLGGLALGLPCSMLQTPRWGLESTKLGVQSPMWVPAAASGPDLYTDAPISCLLLVCLRSTDAFGMQRCVVSHVHATPEHYKYGDYHGFGIWYDNTII
jgi:hypothetical protein